MRPRRPLLEIFTLSFLDIISCAFGAIIMLVLLAKNGEEGEYFDLSVLSQLVSQLGQAEGAVSRLNQQVSDSQTALQQASQQQASLEDRRKQLEAELSAAKDKVQQLASTAQGLQSVLESRQRAATSSGDAKQRDEEVGGIPVDSEYVIFIVETSGSMKSIWGRVMQEMDNILSSHPKVRGFQIMNDMGDYLLSASAGGWRPDTPSSRKAMLSALSGWNSNSNSSPVEGLEVALSTYARKTDKLAIYIFGDDYTGGSYDAVIETLNRLNTDKNSGKRLARVHAVGFLTNSRNAKFSTLMRAVTRQNRGSFLAMPL